MKDDLLHKNSGKINTLFEATYEVVKPINKSSVTGFKLVRDKGENFYSVLTGSFRYKTGRIRGNYHRLYKETPSFNQEMVEKTAVFKNLEDVEKFFPKLSQDKSCCVVKMEISGDLKFVKGSNKHKQDVEMYIGNTIKSIQRI